MKAIAIMAMLMGFAAAQEVRLANHSTAPFSGWKRVVVDKAPPHRAGITKGTTYVVGRQVGLDTHVVDVRVSLPPGGAAKLDLATAEPIDWLEMPLPDDPTSYFGGIAKVGGVALNWVSLVVDGAGYTAHLRCRTGRLLNVDLWLTWYPDRPSIAIAEALVTASNSTVPDISEQLAAPLTLAFGDALVLVDGAPAGQLVAAGVTFGDGQSRLVPLTLVWTRHLNIATEWSNVGAIAERGVGAVGISQLLPEGNPVLPPGFDAARWTQARWTDSQRRLHTWEGSTSGLGVAKASGQTGAQSDQWFVGGESLQAPGSEWIQYWNAAKWSNRPCHLLMPDGRPVDGTGLQQRLVLWDMRPHWHTGVSPERLGKIDTVTASTTNGWWGADVEHWLIGGLVAGCRYTGSPALQHLLEVHARAYPLQWTIQEGWSTSNAYAARAIGYECRNAVLMWRNLEDRALAKQVRSHWLARWEKVLKPFFAYMDGRFPGAFYMDVRTNDPRLGDGDWWIPWQQGVGCHGLRLAGEEFGVPEARERAFRYAMQIVDDAWLKDGSRWESLAQRPVSGSVPTPVPNESFNYFGLSLGPATVLREQPGHARAREIWSQLSSEASLQTQTSWLAPWVK